MAPADKGAFHTRVVGAANIIFCITYHYCKVAHVTGYPASVSARAYTRIIKIARSIADLAGAADIAPKHLAEAASYRILDRRNILDL